MSTAQKWSVTMTSMSDKREWGCRCEWVGGGYVFSLQVVAAPAIRIILFGWSLYLGRLLKVTTITHNMDDVAASKGWVRDAKSNN